LDAFFTQLAEAMTCGENGLLSTELEGIHATSVDRLRRAGMIRVTETEFGEQRIALRPETVTWDISTGIGSPVALSRIGVGPKLLREHKLQLLIALHLEGWRPGRPEVPFRRDGALVYKPGKALTYYACLLDRENVIAKVPEIPHDNVHHYYRCLLLLSCDDLQTCMAGGARQGDEWWRKQCVYYQGDDAEMLPIENAEPADVGDPIPIDEGNGPPLEIAEEMQSLGWLRCVIHIGGQSERLHVKFDNHSHESGVQRGWATCTRCKCVRWRSTKNFRSRIDFCTDMYAWFKGFTMPGDEDPRQHFF
jgi:hypothetical protein